MQIATYPKWQRARDNEVDAFIPEHWVAEGLRILRNHLVVSRLFWRNYNSEVAALGDTVNVPKPNPRTSRRKDAQDPIVRTAAIATTVPVVLNQHFYDAFILHDRHRSLAFPQMVEQFLRPSMIGMAETMDLAAMGQIFQFYYDNVVNSLGSLTNSTGTTWLGAIDETMTQNKAPLTDRFLVHTPRTKNLLLSNEEFTAEKKGDGGTALDLAQVGHYYNMTHVESQHTPWVKQVIAPRAGACDGGAAAGASTIPVKSFNAQVFPGQWFVAAGENVPHRIISVAGSDANPDAFTFEPALKAVVADNAVISVYDPAELDGASNYPVGYAKELDYDNSEFTAVPGLPVTFGNNRTIYMVIDASEDTILLDRPLEAEVSGTARINPMPPGNYAFVMHPMAVALVNRPLALPDTGGVVAARMVDPESDLSLRMVAQYNIDADGTIYKFDALCGFKQMYAGLGLVSLA